MENDKNYLFSTAELMDSSMQLKLFFREVLGIANKFFENEKEQRYPVIQNSLDIYEIEDLLQNLHELMRKVYEYHIKIETNIGIANGRLTFEEAIHEYDNKIEKMVKKVESANGVTATKNQGLRISEARHYLQNKLSSVGIDLTQREKILKSFWEKDVFITWADEEMIKKFPLFFYFLNEKLLEDKIN